MPPKSRDFVSPSDQLFPAPLPRRGSRAARSAGIVDPVLQSYYGSSLAIRKAVFQGRRVDFHCLWEPHQMPMSEHGESGMHALKKSQ